MTEMEKAGPYEQIRQTIAAYTVAGDSRNGELYQAQFADDAVLEFAAFPPLPGFRCEGIGQIRERTATWSMTPGMDPSLSRTPFIRHHLTTGRIVLLDADNAEALSYFTVITAIGPDHAGTYSDRLVREGDRWLIAHRRIALDWRSEQSLFPPLASAKPGDVAPALDANKQVVFAFLRAMSEGDAETAARCLAPDAVAVTKGFSKLAGAEDRDRIIEMIGAMRQFVPTGLGITIRHAIAEGERVAVEFEGNALTSDGTPYCNQYCMVFTLASGRIVLSHEYFCTKLAEDVLWPVIEATFAPGGGDG